MKTIKFILIFSLCMVFASKGQTQDRYSAVTKRFLTHVESNIKKAQLYKRPLTFSKSVMKEFLVKKINNDLIVRSLMLVNSGLNEANLSDLGITINSKIGNIWTAEIPVRSLSQLGKIRGLDFIEIDTPVKTKLDSARADTKVDLVHNGIGLPQSYTGEGVIVGVIDGGLDFTHPTLQDQNGNLRLTRVWDQADDSGTPPVGYSYGSEYADPAEILSQQGDTEADQASHATHVTGIAAGSGKGSSGMYGGVAPGAEIVYVHVGGGSGIIDGVAYIFNYAASVGKPAVINMSLGTHIGPHDGTSSLDQALDTLAGPGKILVGAAGNEGSTPLHISHTFSSDTIATAVELTDNGTGFLETIVEIWGSPNSDFSVAVALLDTTTDEHLGSSEYFAASSAVFGSVNIYESDGDTASVSVAAVPSSPTNQKPNIQLQMSNNTTHVMVLVLTSANSTVHMWNHGDGNGLPFSDLGDPDLQNGNTDYTVGEIGGTSNSVITAGAYTTKTMWTDIDSSTLGISATLHNIADFSSRGPTADERVKPEITAPGSMLASGGSSFDFTLDSQNIVARVDNDWPYVMQQGTSMASPMTAGIVALMLQANSTLTKSTITSIFAKTSRTDAFTGSIPVGGSNTWGYGKIDAQAAIAEAASLTSVAESDILPLQFHLANNYPNPFNPVTTISYTLPYSEFVSLKIYNINGQEIATLVNQHKETGRHIVTFDAENLPSGVLFYRISAGHFNQIKKMVIVK